MIRDLLGSVPASEISGDVAIIGAGTVGLVIGEHLRALGKHVIVLESGGERQDADTHPLNEVVQLAQPYHGASAGRFRCIGGTSTRWGGAMLPFSVRDMAGWPLSAADIAAYVAPVERLFDLPVGSYAGAGLLPADGAAGFVPRLAKWPPFAKRNVATLFQRSLRSDSGVDLYIHAHVRRLQLGADGRIVAIDAQAPAHGLNGATLRVHARQIIIAAGAIESTRLLLLLDRQHDGQIFGPASPLGRGFHDHLSAVVGTVVPHSRRQLNRTMGIAFQQGGMRNPRFERARKGGDPAGFVQVSFKAIEGGGFDRLREIYRRLQQGRLPGIALAAGLVGDLPWLARAAWWRMVEHRLLYPDDAAIELNAVIEQPPRPENRIGLSDTACDPFGDPLAILDWHVAPEDQAALTQFADSFIALWRAHLGRFGVIQRRPDAEAEADLARGGGIFHPGGTIAMAASASEGVVDARLRSFAIPNLTIASTAAFPSGGSANPTMTLLMAGLRAADFIANEI